MAEHGIVAAHFSVIGDSPEDIRAAAALGTRGYLVLTGWPADPSALSIIREQAGCMALSIVEAGEWILEQR